jgi:hypothetical protein
MVKEETCNCGVCRIRDVFAVAKILESFLSKVDTSGVPELFEKLNKDITTPSALAYIQKQRRVLKAVNELQEALKACSPGAIPLKVSSAVQFLPSGNRL